MHWLISHLFIPQERNNHRAALLSPNVLLFLLVLHLLNQSAIKSLTLIRPGVLGYSSEITVEKIVNLTNLERQKNGLSPLSYNSTLSQSAIAKAEDMFANNYWAHTSPQGKNPWEFFKSAGYQYSLAGENLAKDFYDTDSVISAWMKSPTHRANILHDKYQEIGVGVVNGVLNGVKTTLVVQHFGTPLEPNTVAIPKTVPPANVLANNSSSAFMISPLAITKTFGLIIFLIIIVALFIDGFVTLRAGHHRLSGSNLGHIGFLVIIAILLLYTRQGTIF